MMDQEKVSVLGDKTRVLHEAHASARNRLNEEMSSKENKKWQNPLLQQKQKLYHEWKDEEHPGCQLLSGHLLLDQAPGNFHILARSEHHDLVPHMTNVSHMVHLLTIGDPSMAMIKIKKGNTNIPPEVATKMNPMDGNVYLTTNLHESYHHVNISKLFRPAQKV